MSDGNPNKRKNELEPKKTETKELTNELKKTKISKHSSSPEPPETNVLDTEEETFNPMTNSCRDIHDVYRRVNSIDQGVYGSVHQGEHKKSGKIVALKKVKIKAGHRNGFPITALRETNLLMTLKHPNIVDVKEVVIDKFDNGVFMVMEYMEHDLKHVMQHFMQNAFTVSEVKCLMQQLLKGIAFMHKNWVLHRDLKTSNLLYDNKGHLKICDFGMARKYGEPLHNYSPNVITLWYRAPELLLGDKTYGTSVDMWSAGAIMAELLLKKVLFEGQGELDQIEKIFKVLGTPNTSVWPGLKSLPGNSICASKRFRSSLKNVMSHSGRLIISEMGLTLLRSLLHYNPRRRISAEKALQHPWFKENPVPQSCDLMPTFPSRVEYRKRKKQQTSFGVGIHNRFPYNKKS